ncbi:MAG: DUF4276 family protein [Polyangia bacterium]
MTKRALILVEGQTEERFVKDVLAPAFWAKQLYLAPTILVTKRVKDGPNFKGGVTSFAKFKNDAQRLIYSAGGALVTTLIDYYGLPLDFPGMTHRPAGSPINRVMHIENEIRATLQYPPNFVPFLILHEFEALLFSEPSVLPQVMTDVSKQQHLTTIRQSVSTPEDINERPEYAPSKRILACFPSYNKTLHGPLTAERIGLARMRAECPHFAAWLSMLETYAAG